MIQIYFFMLEMQDYLDLYTIREISEKLWVERHKVAKDKIKYIPVRLRTSQTRNNKGGYWIRYLDREVVAEYLRTHRNSWKKEK